MHSSINGPFKRHFGIKHEPRDIINDVQYLSKPSKAYKIDNWYKWLEHVEQMASAIKMGR
jgi:hypothetical protein